MFNDLKAGLHVERPKHAMMPLTKTICILLGCFLLCDVARATRMAQHSSWQEGVLCRAGNRGVRQCNPDDVRLQAHPYQTELAGSSSWPVMISSSSSSSSYRQGTAGEARTGAGGRFVMLARFLAPKEANVQFAQAFCASLGGRLAFWTSTAEFAALVNLARGLSASQRTTFNVYVGAVQLPGSSEPLQGWVWLHKPYQVPRTFPWAPGEPNQHNGATTSGHTEDCAVLATHHKPGVQNILDDFPCNYGTTPAGKYMFGGHNPHLTVACRVGAQL